MVWTTTTSPRLPISAACSPGRETPCASGLLYVAGHARPRSRSGGSAAVVFRIAFATLQRSLGGNDWWASRFWYWDCMCAGDTFFRPSSFRPASSPSSPHGHGHQRARTRITLLINGALWVYWRLSLIFGGTRVEAPQVFKDGYGTSSTFLVGVIHGLGAETPTQILLFLMAANLGGTGGAGLLGLWAACLSMRPAGDEYPDVRPGGWIVLGR